jgi:predicted ATP-binding protein involved in virulence
LPPNINDLLSLINNEGDYRLETFSSWIADLDAEANKKEIKAISQKWNEIIPERVIIKKVFHLISEITGQKTDFLEVRQQSTNDVWISTEDSPNGIPLRLISQGFQAIIGWIGYFLQRMAECYPYTDDFTNEPSILIIDEIDTYIHPRWQKKIINVLIHEFPRTQFIIATHSPLLVDGLNRHQIIQLKREENSYHIIAESNPIDIWAWSYHDILHNLYNTTINQNKYTLEELEQGIHTLEEKKERNREEDEELASLKDNYNKLKASIEYHNEMEQIKKKYKEREQELREIIEKIKRKK